MTLKKRGVSNAEGDNNIFWTTMSDLMLGLAIVFMTLFVFAMTGFTQDSVRQKMKQVEVSNELVEQLKRENIEAQVDKLSGDVKILDLELFEVGSYELSPRGKKYLDKFVPIYVNTVFSNDDIVEQIDAIIIQGHTDSQSFSGVKDPDEHYVKNMTLSLQRANSIAEYMFKTRYNKQYTTKLKSFLAVEGRSSSDPVMINGKEDLDKSRRVELRLKTRKLDIMNIFISGALNKSD